jgi:hypothetical protein
METSVSGYISLCTKIVFNDWPTEARTHPIIDRALDISDVRQLRVTFIYHLLITCTTITSSAVQISTYYQRMTELRTYFQYVINAEIEAYLETVNGIWRKKLFANARSVRRCYGHPVTTNWYCTARFLRHHWTATRVKPLSLSAGLTYHLQG